MQEPQLLALGFDSQGLCPQRRSVSLSGPQLLFSGRVTPPARVLSAGLRGPSLLVTCSSGQADQDFAFAGLGQNKTIEIKYIC